MRGRVGLGVGLAAIAVAGCAGEREAPRAGASAPASPHMALLRPEFGEQDAGKPVWKAKADRAVYRPDAKVADLTGVDARFFEDGRAVTRGRAPTAVWRQAERDLRLAGGVTLESLGTKAGVGAREARWDPASGRLLATGGVKFWQGANRLQAADLRADRALRRVELRGGVHGQFALGPGTGGALAGSTGGRATR
jgi:LPS export ABC transporter protein LptC